MKFNFPSKKDNQSSKKPGVTSSAEQRKRQSVSEGFGAALAATLPVSVTGGGPCRRSGEGVSLPIDFLREYQIQFYA